MNAYHTVRLRSQFVISIWLSNSYPNQLHKTTDLAKLEFSARPEYRLKKEYGVNEAKR